MDGKNSEYAVAIFASAGVFRLPSAIAKEYDELLVV